MCYKHKSYGNLHLLQSFWSFYQSHSVDFRQNKVESIESNRRKMLRSLLLLCTLYMSHPSVGLTPVEGNSAVNQTLNSINRGLWNKSASFSNVTGPGIAAKFNSSYSATGQSPWNSSNKSIENGVPPSLDIYNNVSCLFPGLVVFPRKRLELRFQVEVPGSVSTLG